MKILHYSIGLSPNRSGGMVTYTEALLNEQAKNHEIVFLYPGRIKKGKSSSIIKKKTRTFYVLS